MQAAEKHDGFDSREGLSQVSCLCKPVLIFPNVATTHLFCTPTGPVPVCALTSLMKEDFKLAFSHGIAVQNDRCSMSAKKLKMQIA